MKKFHSKFEPSKTYMDGPNAAQQRCCTFLYSRVPAFKIKMLGLSITDFKTLSFWFYGFHLKRQKAGFCRVSREVKGEMAVAKIMQKDNEKNMSIKKLWK